jgi:hypothetical protein
MRNRTFLLWIIAFLITIASAAYQRLTGPTYPVHDHVTLNGMDVRYTLARSHGGTGDFPLLLVIPDTTVRGTVDWRRFKSADDWNSLPLTRSQDTLSARLPHQPPAGKLVYRIHLQDARQTVTLPEAGAVVMRFKGDVPTVVLIIHILLIFSAMLFSARAGLEAFAGGLRVRAFTLWTAGLLFIGGLVLGPVVQKYAFDAYWTGWPFGTDLTDNKTALALFAWIVAAFMLPRSAHPKRWIIGAALVTFAVFLIPHSMFGSELDYTKPAGPH